MRMISRVRNVNRFWIFVSLSCVVLGCQQSESHTQSSTGFIDFGKSVERAYGRLAKGNIHKKAGFYNECSVDFSTETGIRISQSVCDDGGNVLNVTIRVTDPASRPPSQRQNRISVVLLDLGKTSLGRDHSKEFPNGTTIKIDRTGQSAILTRRLLVSR